MAHHDYGPATCGDAGGGLLVSWSRRSPARP